MHKETVECVNKTTPTSKAPLGTKDPSETLTEAYGTPPSSEVDFIDITAAIGPGVDVIKDSISGRGYYGESGELAIRLGRHKQALEKGIHDNSALQKAWDDTADKSQFRFIILEWGSGLENVGIRKVKEAALIKANSNLCFNKIPGVRTKPQRAIVRPVIINSIRYRSTRDAGCQLKRSRIGILRDIRDAKKPDTYFCSQEQYRSPSVFVQIGRGGKEGPVLFFRSMNDVIAANFAKSAQMIRRRIASQHFPNWKYAVLDNTGKPTGMPYTLKPGEIDYEQWLQQQTQLPSA
jgi:hypothetical protein